MRALLLTLGPGVCALAAPDAGTLQQERDREQVRRLPQQASPLVPPAAASSPKRGDALVVQDFKFRGNTLLSSAQLSLALESYRQRPLDFKEIEALSNLISAAYREQG